MAFKKEIPLTRRKFAFPFLVVIFFQTVLPSSNVGFSSLTNWGDQSYLLKSMKEMHDGAGSSTPELMGMGYAAVAQLLKQFVGSYELALVGLSLLSFTIIYTVLLQKILQIQDAFSKIYSIAILVSSYFLLRIPHIRDIPWSHFITASVFFVLIWFYSKQNIKTTQKYFIYGFILFLLWQIRNFETIGVLLGLIFTLALNSLIKTSDAILKIRKLFLQKMFSFSFGAFLAWALIFIITGSGKFFMQYSHLPGPDFSFERFVSRVIAVVYNPSHESINSISLTYWMPQLSNLVSLDLSKVWFQPLMKSQPAFLPLILISIILLVLQLTYSILKRSEIFLLPIFCLVVGLTITFGYFIQPVFNQSQLKYGALREFIFPQFLFILGLIETFLTLQSRKIEISKPKLGILYLIAPFVFLISCLVPKPSETGFQDYRFDLYPKNCHIEGTKCLVIAKVLTAEGWRNMESQPIELRVLENGLTKRVYDSDFVMEEDLCLTVCSVYGVPLSLGFAETPEAETFFTSKKDQWIEISKFR